MGKRTRPEQNFYNEAILAAALEDHARAYRLFKQAAASGDRRAYNKVGACLASGLGVERDTALAYVWYRQGANRRDPAAYLNLANFFRDAGDVRRSRFWLDKALAHGDAQAAFERARMHLATPSPDSLQRARELLIAACASTTMDAESRDEAKRLLAQVRRQTQREPRFRSPAVAMADLGPRLTAGVKPVDPDEDEA